MENESNDDEMEKFEIEIELTKLKGPICKAHGIGRVDGKVCVEADMTFALT